MIRPTISNLKATYDFDEALLSLVWSVSAGAVSYQTQYRSAWNDGWSEWTDLGEDFATSRSFVISQTSVEYRVRALTMETAGPWSTGHFDGSVPMPDKIELSLETAYIGGNLALQWLDANAQEIILVVSVGTSERMRIHLDGSETSHTIDAAAMESYGGPWREVSVVAISKSSIWEENSAPLSVLDLAPAKVMDVSVSHDDVTGDAIVSWSAAAGADITGYVVAHVNSLGEASSFEVEGSGVTNLDIPVSAGTNSFAVAAKDAFYDVAKDIFALNFSDPVSLEVL